MRAFLFMTAASTAFAEYKFLLKARCPAKGQFTIASNDRSNRDDTEMSYEACEVACDECREKVLNGDSDDPCMMRGKQVTRICVGFIYTGPKTFTGRCVLCDDLTPECVEGVCDTGTHGDKLYLKVNLPPAVPEPPEPPPPTPPPYVIPPPASLPSPPQSPKECKRGQNCMDGTNMLWVIIPLVLMATGFTCGMICHGKQQKARAQAARAQKVQAQKEQGEER